MIKTAIELHNLQAQLESLKKKHSKLVISHRSQVSALLKAGQKALQYNPNAVLYGIALFDLEGYSFQVKANTKFSTNRLRIHWSFDDVPGYIPLESIIAFTSPELYAKFLSLEHLRYYNPKKRSEYNANLPYLGSLPPSEKLSLGQCVEAMKKNSKKIIMAPSLEQLLKRLSI